MTTFFKSALLALSLGAAGLSASIPAASAAGLEYRFGGGENSIIIRDHNSDRDRGRQDWRRGHDDRRDGWGRDGGRRHGRHLDQGFCDPDRAIGKARSMGLHRARIVEANRRYVSVDGFNRGRRVEVTFANVWSCPVAGYR